MVLLSESKALSTRFWSMFFLLLLFSLPQDSFSFPLNRAVTATDLLQAKSVEGAWKLVNTSGPKDARLAGATAIRIAEDGFFTVAYFNHADKKFIGTYGGTYTFSNGKIRETLEFNTLDTALVGSTFTGNSQFKGTTWKHGFTLGKRKSVQTWERITGVSPVSPLNGAWRISGRMGPDGKLTEMPLRVRRTIKILSGSRFQWIAYNVETKELSGTGGGTFTTQNGKYTEHIEFFSRDSSRVGNQLTFDFDIIDGKWHHSGLSSTGVPIDEYWQRHLETKEE
ncbi:hypothetical protein [Rufibacter radiotolerans]|uniref:hypothetical protein n=1 Tax=Rufibacter radiotolerans TaxID=1379910 RepID=UPI0009E2D9FD|nr:hypothetical protein [Rufibacter radiotolerans]